MWINHWCIAKQGYVDNFIKGFINYVQGKLKEAEVYEQVTWQVESIN